MEFDGMLEDDVDRVLKEYDSKQKAQTYGSLHSNSKLNLLTALGVAFLLVSVATIGTWAGFMIQRDARDLSASLDSGDKASHGGDGGKDAQETPGTIPGGFTVDLNGQASYSMPIQVPPGTAGIEPKLSIDYNSGWGNGLLGVGFRIGGLYAIIRDACDLTHDGYIATRFSDQGKLAIDGQRLVLENGSNYTFSQIQNDLSSSPTEKYIEFRKQIDDNTRIHAWGHSGHAGLAGFIVERPDGIVMTYGYVWISGYGEVDGRICTLNGWPPHTWALSKVEDQYGNYIVYEYEKDQNNNTYRISIIRYTGNGETGVSPYNTVNFFYEDRDDDLFGYEGGLKFVINQRLNRIETKKKDGSTVLKYCFEYEESKSSERLLLDKVCLESGDELLSYRCTEFGWTESDNTLYPPEVGTNTIDSGLWNYSHIPMDVNGDGRYDIVQLWCAGNDSVGFTARAEVDLSTGESFNIGASNEGLGPWGREYISGTGWGISSKVHLRNIALGQGLFGIDKTYHESGYWASTDQYVPADIDGDGLEDLIKIYKDNNNHAIAQIWWSESNYFSAGPTIDLGEWYSDYSSGGVLDRYLSLDANGDGRSDLVRIWKEGDQKLYLRAYLSDGTNLVSYYDPLLLTNTFYYFMSEDEYVVMDINGDGQDDVVWIAIAADNTGWYAKGRILMSLGQYFELKSGYYDFGYIGEDLGSFDYFIKTNRFMPANSNGDGCADLIKIGQLASSSTSVYLTTWFSDGNGFTSPIENYVTGWNFEEDPIYYVPADFNGDRRTDVFIVGESWNGWHCTHDVSWCMSKGTGHYIFMGTLLSFTTYQKHHSSPSVYLPMDINGDARTDLFVGQSFDTDSTEYFSVYLAKEDSTADSIVLPDLLIDIEDGRKAHINIYYKPIVDDEVYKGPSGNLPADTRLFRNPLWLVSYTKQSSFEGKYYEYWGAKFHRLGFGFLGFHQVHIKEKYGNLYRTQSTYYRQDFPYIGLIESQARGMSNSNLPLIFVETGYDLKTVAGSSPRYQVRWLGTTIIKRNYPDYKFISMENSWVHNAMYDEYGNPLKIVSRIWNTTNNTASPIHLEQTTTTYENRDFPNQWIIGLPTTVTFSQSVDWNSGYRTRYTEYEYNAQGFLFKEKIEPNATDNALKLVKTYEYDDFGNRETIAHQYYNDEGNPHEIWITRCQYDTQGQFMDWEKNALSQVITYDGWDDRFGLPITITNANGLITHMSYDGLGRIQTIDYPDNKITNYDYFFHPSNTKCNCIEQMTTGSPTVTTYYDEIGREYFRTKDSFDGGIIHTKTEYDSHGRVLRNYKPSFPTPQYYTKYTYDVLDRVEKIEEHIDENSAVATTEYDYNVINYQNGNDVFLVTYEIEITDPLGHISILTKNAMDQMTEFTDAINAKTTFEYDSSGNLIKKMDPAGIIFEWEYDIRNRLISQDDPNSGESTFSYDGLDHQIQTVDVKGQTFTMQYDDVGRMTQMTRPDGSDVWVYDNPSNGIGMLWKSYNSNTAGSLISQQEYSYDSLGRLQTEKTTVDNTQYVFSYSYDSYSRLGTLTYPSGLVLTYTYNQYGYNMKISKSTTNIPVSHQNSGTVDLPEPNPSSVSSINDDDFSEGVSPPVVSSTVWELLEMNAYGQITKEQYGNGLVCTRRVNNATGQIDEIKCCPQNTPGSLLQHDSYTYDANGNILQRVLGYQGTSWSYLTENFQYDALNRLIQTDVAVPLEPITMSYHGYSGNILSKSDVVGNLWEYTDPLHPNAITGISLGMNTEQLTEPKKEFTYDASGNMLTSYDYETDTELDMTYLSYDLIKDITKNVNGVTQYGIAYTYDAGGNKIQQTEYDKTTSPYTTAKTVFVGDSYEEYQVTLGGSDHLKKHYIYAGGKPVGLFTIDDQGSMEMNYLLTDHLGSMEVITDENGNVLERFSYDAWGKRRNPDGSAYTGGESELTKRGFTGHKHVDDLGLIDMKARMYDSHIAMFQSVDPLGGGYTYVSNNPLRFTDPSGLVQGADGRRPPSGPGGFTMGEWMDEQWASLDPVDNGGLWATGSAGYNFFSGFSNSWGSGGGGTSGSPPSPSSSVGSSSSPVAGGCDCGFHSAPPKPDWQKISDSEKIEIILSALRNAVETGQDFIDLRDLFENFPNINGKRIDLFDNIHIGQEQMTVHMGFGVMDDMGIGVYCDGEIRGWDFSSTVKTASGNTYWKKGYWKAMSFPTSRGAQGAMFIHSNRDINIIMYYLYPHLNPKRD